MSVCLPLRVRFGDPQRYALQPRAVQQSTAIERLYKKVDQNQNVVVVRGIGIERDRAVDEKVTH